KSEAHNRVNEDLMAYHCVEDRTKVLKFFNLKKLEDHPLHFNVSGEVIKGCILIGNILLVKCKEDKEKKWSVYNFDTSGHPSFELLFPGHQWVLESIGKGLVVIYDKVLLQNPYYPDEIAQIRHYKVLEVYNIKTGNRMPLNSPSFCVEMSGSEIPEGH